MFHSENDLLANLIVLSPKSARKKFRESIFDAWHYKCAYCEKQLCNRTATIDHVVPKHKGGHNVRRNMVCSCASCNQKKGSSNWETWYKETPYYSKEKTEQILKWMDDVPLNIELQQVDFLYCL